MIELVDSENLYKRVEQLQQPVLVVCIHFGSGFAKQMSQLQVFMENCLKELKVLVVHEDSLESVKKKMGVTGTPLYVTFDRGKEKGRILGKATPEKLEALIGTLLSSSERQI